ncbi:MAG: ubiquinol-cytochrome c reductase iron-sulfur subunit [Actinomycetota bacterium]
MRDRRAVLLVLAVVVVAGVGTWWAVGRPGQDHAGAVARWRAPAPGEAEAGFLDDGTPVLAVAHRDGSVTAVEAVSPHRAWGVQSLLGWCPSSRTFDDPFHGSKFDEYGRYLLGPAPAGLVRLRVRAIRGSPPHIQLGTPTEPLPRSAGVRAPPGSSCLGPSLEETGLLMPHVAESGLTPRGVVALAPPKGGRWSVHAVLVAGTDVTARLCAAVSAAGTCAAGVPIAGILPSLLPPAHALHIPGVWLVLVQGNGLADPIRAG